MAGTGESEIQKSKEDEDSSFKWDENSQLYYHSSSGFYHDPNAGWYYSSRDGHYYKFEKGNYELLDSGEASSHQAYDTETHTDAINTGNTESTSNELPGIPPPPSEWLEDTLIELYLSGYSNHAIDFASGPTAASDERVSEDIIGFESLNYSTDGARNDDAYELEEGEWIPDENDLSSEGAYQDEENWRAHYGQVIEPDKESVPSLPLVDIWDWTMVRGKRKNGKGEVARLIGRLVRRSIKLHPSMPSSSGLLRTAPICAVHLDLVRVTSGQVYKLRTPSAKYLSTIQTYDSSNPTRDWGFAELSTEGPIQKLPKSGGISESEMIQGHQVCKDSLAPDQISVPPKNTKQAYRDRAAERRALHGGFGVGPGQKRSSFDADLTPSSPVSDCHEEAAAESINQSFGAGSYARRILENMGWQEGEALGSSVNGLKEPLPAVGNKGNAGLGWEHGKRKLL